MNYFTHRQAANFAAEEFRFADFGTHFLAYLFKKLGIALSYRAVAHSPPTFKSGRIHLILRN
jgi:hypothetical protein